MVNEDNSGTSILIDYYHGAYGPTIRIDVRSLENLLKIKHTFLMLAQAKMSEVNFHQVGAVEMTGMESLNLKLISGKTLREKTLVLVNTTVYGPVFEWSRCSAGWIKCSGLIDGLINLNSPGHQYLTDEAVDDALIEVAFQE